MVTEPSFSYGTSGEGGTPYNIERTAPDRLLRHDISDEDLDMFMSARRDGLFELMCVFFGVALGDAIAALESVEASYLNAQPIPLSGLGLAKILICAVPLCLAIALWAVSARRAGTTQSLVTKIRQRTAVRLRAATAPPAGSTPGAL